MRAQRARRAEMARKRSEAGRLMVAVAGLVAFVACLTAFAAIAEGARQPAIPPVDTSSTTLLHDLTSPGLDTLMTGITGLGSTPVLAVLASLAVVLVAVRGHRAQALFVAIALVASLVLNHALKLLFGRPRPALDWAEARPDHAFPSGHAMNAFVLYVALALIAWHFWGRRAGIAAMALSLVVVMAVGASRVYLGVHWLTDVVGGFLAGAMLLLVLAAVFAGAGLVSRKGS
jgi:undecaprenyl-diphosphatase